MTAYFVHFNENRWLEEQRNTPQSHLHANVPGIIGFLVIRDSRGDFRMLYSTDADNGEANYFVTIPKDEWFFAVPMEDWVGGKTVYDIRTHINYDIFETDDSSVKILERVDIHL